MKDWLKENWFLIVFLSAAFGIYVEWRVTDSVVKTVSGVQIVSPDELEKVETATNARFDLVEAKVDNNTKTGDKLDSKIERIVDILLEP